MAGPAGRESRIPIVDAYYISRRFVVSTMLAKIFLQVSSMNAGMGIVQLLREIIIGFSSDLFYFEWVYSWEEVSNDNFSYEFFLFSSNFYRIGLMFNVLRCIVKLCICVRNICIYSYKYCCK